MALPSAPDPGEDPTTQIPWPAAKSRYRSPDPDNSAAQDEGVVDVHEDVVKVAVTAETAKQRLSTWNLITLSISMAGAQIAWTVELGYVLGTLLAVESYVLTRF